MSLGFDGEEDDNGEVVSGWVVGLGEGFDMITSSLSDNELAVGCGFE